MSKKIWISTGRDFNAKERVCNREDTPIPEICGRLKIKQKGFFFYRTDKASRDESLEEKLDKQGMTSGFGQESAPLWSAGSQESWKGGACSLSA